MKRRAAFRIGCLAAIVILTLSSRKVDRSHRSAGPFAGRDIDSQPKLGRHITTVAGPQVSSPGLFSDERNELSPRALTIFVEARLREWEADDDPERRDARTQELERLLIRERPDVADRLKIIEALPAHLMDFAFGLPSFQQWMFSNHRAAIDWISDHPGISEGRVLTLFQDWGAKDRKELRLYLAELPQGEWKQKAMTAASYEAISLNPVEAVVWARQMNAGGAQSGLLEIATAEWARRDAQGAGGWVSQIRDPALREQLIGSLLVGYADTAPELVAEWTTRSLPPGRILDRSAAEVAGLWARRDPEAAGDWVARFPAGEGRQMALDILLNVWTNRDRAAALAWIGDLPDQTLRAQAVQWVEARPGELIAP